MPNQDLAESVAEIVERRERVTQVWEEFKEAAAQRRSKLEHSKRLQQFIRDADELEAWIAQKLQVATDDAYKDPTNLQVPLETLVISLFLCQ